MSNPEFAFTDQSAAYEGMKRERGRFGSRATAWILGGILALICLVAFVGFILIVVFKFSLTGEGLGERLIVSRPGGPQEAIYYKSGTTEAQALRLASVLRNRGLLDGTAVDIVLARDGDTFIVNIPLLYGAWNKPEVIEFFTELRPALVAEVFDGAAVEIHLCDTRYRSGGLGVQRVIK